MDPGATHRGRPDVVVSDCGLAPRSFTLLPKLEPSGSLAFLIDLVCRG